MSRISSNLPDLDRFEVDVKRVDKPWGHELIYAASESYVGKILHIRKGEQLSLQFHREKDETIYVYSGRVEFEIGDPGKPTDAEVVGSGHAFRLPPGTVHRMRALEDAILLEVSTPHLDDVVRLEDTYGRTDA